MFKKGFSNIKVIRTLGKGGEGIAHLVDHPKFGRVVRKTYNITGKLFSKPIFEKKLEILRKVKSPLLPKFHGQEGNRPITYHEFVKHTKIRAVKTPERLKVVEAINKHVRRVTGVGIKDLGGDNMVRDHQGNYKVIDFLVDDKKLRASTRRGQLKNMMRSQGRPAMAKLLGSFDREAIKHKSRKEIMHNAHSLSRAERDKLIEKATVPGV